MTVALRLLSPLGMATTTFLAARSAARYLRERSVRIGALEGLVERCLEALLLAGKDLAALLVLGKALVGCRADLLF